jgi:hypothetical protein
VNIISDFPDVLGRSAENLGYRYGNKKGMVRSTSLRQNPDGSYTRVIEQVSRSNGTWSSTFSFLEAAGIKTDKGIPDLVALQTPLISTRKDFANGVVDLMRMLDEHSGSNVRYGEFREASEQYVAYKDLRIESIRREREIENFVKNLADLEEQLDDKVKAGQLSNEQRTGIFKDEVSRILDAICTLNPTYAHDTFGKETVLFYEEIAVLYAQGREREAMQVLHQVQDLKQTVTFCGLSIPVERAKEMGLKVNSVGDLIEQGKDSWEWKQGVCAVKTCSSRPGKTEVGPCSICKSCQEDFDHGNDPTKKLGNNVLSLFSNKENVLAA